MSFKSHVADALIRFPEVEILTGYCRSKLYRLLAAGEFPQPIRRGRSVRFSASEVAAWVESQKATRNEGEQK